MEIKILLEGVLLNNLQILLVFCVMGKLFFGNLAASKHTPPATNFQQPTYGVSPLQQQLPSQQHISTHFAAPSQQAHIDRSPATYGQATFNQPNVYNPSNFGQPSSFGPTAYGRAQMPFQPTQMHPFATLQPYVPSFGGHAQSSSPQYMDIALIFQSISIQKPPNNKYYMDSGASSHMSFNSGNMLSLTPCNSKCIMVGNGAVIPVSHIGKTFFQTLKTV